MSPLVGDDGPALTVFINLIVRLVARTQLIRSAASWALGMGPHGHGTVTVRGS